MGLDKRTGRPASDITRLKRVSVPANNVYLPPSVVSGDAGLACGAGYNFARSPGVFKAEASSLVEYYNLLPSNSGLATGTTIGQLSGLCGDTEGNLYVADSVLNSVFKYNIATKRLTLFVGTGRIDSAFTLPFEIIPCATPQGTRIWTPSNLQFINGSLYLCAQRSSPAKVRILKITGNSIQVIDPGISIDNLEGFNSIGYDFLGNIFFNIASGRSSTGVLRNHGMYKYIPATGATETTTTFVSNSGTMYLDTARNMYFTNFTEVIRIAPEPSGNIPLLGTRSFVAAAGGIQNVAASIVDGNGLVFINNISSNRILTSYMATAITDLLHASDTRAFSGDNGPISAANVDIVATEPGGFYSKTFFAIDGSNNFYFLDYTNNRIRKVAAINGIVTSDSIVTTVIGNGNLGNIVESTTGLRV